MKIQFDLNLSCQQKVMGEHKANDLTRVVFSDNGFKNNAIRILKQSGIDDVKSL